MKKQLTLLILMSSALCQGQGQGPGQNFWMLGGNPNFGPSQVHAANNILGTNATANFPLRVHTFGQERMRINANQTQVTTNAVQTFLGGPQNTSGYVGIGLNPTQQAPWSRLHIGVPSGPAATQAYGGYRDWMGEGVTIQRKDDQLFMGHYQWGTASIIKYS